MKKLLLPVALLAVVLYGCIDNREAGQPGKNDAIAVPEPVGKKLFKGNCMQCHALTQDRTGPALAGVKARWNNPEKLTDFVRNSQKVISTDGPDSYAGKLFDKWYKTAMPAFGGLSDDDIKQILDYVDKGVE